MVGENLDLSSDPAPAAPALPARVASDEGRLPADTRYVGIQFACCDVYARIYLAHDATAYRGNCPRCLRRVELKVDPQGSSSRFFTAY